MLFFYNLSIRAYYLVILLASLRNQKAREWIQGRKKILLRISEKVDPGSKYIWIHTASLGEFEQGRPVIERLKKNKPEIKIFLTFFSPSGYNIRKNYELADLVFYLPLDTRKNAKRLISILLPEEVYFIKYEFWYHYLNQLHKNKIPTYLVSSIFRENQLFFRWYGKWYRKMLGFFSHIFVQNGTSCELLKKFNINHFTLSGDTRIDRVFSIASKSSEFPEITQFVKSDKVVVFGSTWKKDEELIIQFINSHRNLTGIKYIIAPHEIHKDRIEEFRKEIQLPSITHSDLKTGRGQDSLCLIIDSIGILSSVYKFGKIAYIGGGFGRSIHNILEPAAFNLPVIFGPNYNKFNEAVELVNNKGAFAISDFKSFDNILMNLINDPVFYASSQQQVNLFIKNNLGAIDIIMNQIEKTSPF